MAIESKKCLKDFERTTVLETISEKKTCDLLTCGCDEIRGESMEPGVHTALPGFHRQK